MRSRHGHDCDDAVDAAEPTPALARCLACMVVRWLVPGVLAVSEGFVAVAVERPAVQGGPQVALVGYTLGRGHEDRGHGGERVGDRHPALRGPVRPFQVDEATGEVEPGNRPLLPDC